MSTRAGSNRKTLGKLEVAREKPGTVDFNPLSWKCSSSAPPLPRSTVFFFFFSHKVIPFFPVDFPAFPRLDAFVILFGVSCCVFLIAFFFFCISPCTLHMFCQYPRRHLVFMALGDCLWDQDKPHQHRLYFVYAEHPACSSVQPPE